MTRPNWLSEWPVYEVHEDQIAEHGGAPGIRDPGLADIALAPPLNAFAYGVEDIFDLAALYAAGIVKPPPSSMATIGRALSSPNFSSTQMAGRSIPRMTTSSLAFSCAQEENGMSGTKLRGFAKTRLQGHAEPRDSPCRRVDGLWTDFQGHFTTGGMLERMLSTLPPVFRPKVVPRS